MNTEEMEEYLCEQYPNEAGAVRISGVFHTVGAFRCSNSHFIADPKEVARLLDEGEFEIFIHSHLDCPATPSDTDIDMQKLWNIPFWVYRIDDGNIIDKEILS